MRNKKLGQVLLALLFASVLAVSGFAAPGPPGGGIDDITDVGPAAQTLYSSTYVGQTSTVFEILLDDDDTGDNPIEFVEATIDNGGTADPGDVVEVNLYSVNDGLLATFDTWPTTIDLAALGYTIGDDEQDTLQIEVVVAASATDGNTFLFSIDLTYNEHPTYGFVTGPIVDENLDTIQFHEFGADYIGVFRGTPWYLDSNGDVAWNGAIDITYDAFGIAEDRPIAGDWDGDGSDEIGVFRPSTQRWYLDNGNGDWDPGVDGVLGPFGVSEDLPIAGDWDGVGGDEIGVFRPSTQRWYLDNGNGDWDPGVDGELGPWGIPEDLPIAGDWDGDGTAEFGVFRPSTGFFYLDYDGNGVWNGTVDKSYDFGGASGDLPIAGDWDGDDSDEIGVFRPSTQRWYLDLNGNGALDPGETFGPFGVSSDRPIAGRWQTGVGVGPSSVPMSMVSSPVVLVMPNPVTVGGEVTFQVMGAGVNAIQVSIYDLGGGLVYQSELVSGQSVTWDLRFEEGTPVANGIYLYAVTAKAYGELISTKVGKLLILR